MSHASDAWYVRLPDGRVLRASSTRAVRHHIRRGRIPIESRVRRSPDEEWVDLEWSNEFSEVVKRVLEAQQSVEDSQPAIPFSGEPGGIASRLDPFQLQTVGLRGFVDELLAAMDSTLVRKKLILTLIIGILNIIGGLAFVLAPNLLTPTSEIARMAVPIGLGVLLLLMLVIVSSILTQLTYVELARLRPASWPEGTANLARNVIRLLPPFVVIVGAVVAAMRALHALPEWLVQTRGQGPELAEAAALLALVVEVILWPVLALSLPLVPLVVIEEVATIKAISLWMSLLRQHLLRILVYEALAGVLGLIVTLPLTVPIAVAALGMFLRNTLSDPLLITLGVLWALALAPLFAYVTVANVFIYLNLRYEQSPRNK